MTRSSMPRVAALYFGALLLFLAGFLPASHAGGGRAGARSTRALDAPSVNNVVQAFDQTLQSAATADGNGTAFQVGGLPGFTVQVEGTAGGATVSFEGTLDGSNWRAIEGTLTSNHTTATSTTSVGQIWLFTTPLDKFRARISGSGMTTSVTVKGKGGLHPGIPLSSGGGGGGGAVTNDVLTDAHDATNHAIFVNMVSALSDSFDTIGVSPKSGSVFVTTPSASSSATGTSTFSNTALSTTVTAIDASAGNLYGVQIQNPNASGEWVQLFDLSTGSVTLGMTTPKLPLWVPPSGSVNFGPYNPPITFGTAISVAATTTATGSSAPSTALVVSAEYK